MMRSFLMVCLLLISPTLVHAGWRVEGERQEPPDSAVLKHLVVIARGDGHSAEEIHAVLFDRRECCLKVVDLTDGESVADGLKRTGALAGVNGGYFHEDRTPLGLVVVDGKLVHPLEHAKILTGLLVANRTGAWLLRTGEMRSMAKYRQVLQSGPFLVDHAKIVPGLNAVKRAERTVLFADKQGVAGMLITPPLTLAEAAEMLATPGLLPGVTVQRALNLDGGSSTALWIGGESGFSHSEWKQVRDAVGVFLRK